MGLFLIMTKPLPTKEEQGHGPAWWNMEFVKCNDLPVPFGSEEDAREYMAAWNMEEPKYTVWKLSKV